MEIDKYLIQIPPIESRIPSDIYGGIISAIVNEFEKSKTPDEDFAPYAYPIENIQKIADSDNIEYKEGIRTMADDLWMKEDWFNSVMVYYILMHVISLVPTDFYKLGYALGKLKYKDLAQAIIEIYEPLSANQKVTCHAIANFYYTALDYPLKAVEYFEKYLEFDSENAQIYNTLAHLYSRIDDEVSREKYLKALLKAYELKPDDAVIVKSILTYYEKQHNTEKVKELYPKLIEISPNPRHSLNYGLYLMSWGNLNDGGKYFAERYELDNYPIGYPKAILNGPTKWNFKDDISDKTLLIHYEEGFGDSIMYGRFIPLIKQYAKKTVLIIQPQLEKLFRQSPVLSDGIDILTDIKDFVSSYKNEAYVHIPLMDTPYPLGVDSHFIPYSGGYIKATNPMKLDNSKINSGIAYSGDLSANYNARNVGVNKFLPITKIDNVQLYSLQVGDASKELENLDKDISIVDLGKSFNDFTDTANAIMGLDLIISTDNVILNLAGALGKKTYGIFNKYPNYRWFDLSGNDTVWYNSVKPFQCEIENEWEPVFDKIKNEVENEFKGRG